MDTKIYTNLIKNWTKLIAEVHFDDIAASLLQYRIITVDEYKLIVSGNENAVMESCLVLLLKKEESVLLKFADILRKDYCWLSNNLKEGYLQDREGVDEIDASPIVSMEERNNSCFQTSITAINNNENQCDSDTFNSSSLSILSDARSKGNMRRNKMKKSKSRNRAKMKKKTCGLAISSTTSELLDKTTSLNEEVTDEVISIIRKNSLVSKSWTTIAHSLGLTDRVHEIRYKVLIHGEDLSMCVVYLIKDWLEMLSGSATLSKLIEVLRCEGFNNVSDKLSEILHGKKNRI